MSDKIQLYSLATPNGQKASIALEEMEIPYEAHKIDITKGDQHTPDFLAINPNGKIPAIVDPTGDNGKPLKIFESGTILVYLAEKSGRFLPTDKAKRIHTLQWLFFQVGGPGPMFGQFGHFYKYAKDKYKEPYPLERYSSETKRLLGVIDNQLKENKWLAGDEYTIADMATAPWVKTLSGFYEASDFLGLNDYQHVTRWVEQFFSREKVQIGSKVCGF